MNLDIYQLSKLLTKQKVIALGLFKDNKIDTETKYLMFYEKIIANEIKNDKEAKKALNYSKNSPAFLKFKERYIKKVLDYILLFEASVKSNEFINEEYYRLLKLYTAGKIIQFKHQLSNATVIFKYIFDLARKYDFLDLQLYSALELRKLYGYLVPDKKLFDYYEIKLDEIETEFKTKLTLDKIYDKVSHDYTAIKLKDENLFKKDTLSKGVKLLETIKESTSVASKTKAYEIVSFAYSINNRLEDSISISKESILLLEESESASKLKISLAYKDILSAYLKLRDFDNATLYLHKTLALLTQKSVNHFRMKSTEYLLYAVSKDYNKLFKVTMEVINSKELKQHQVLLEEWRLREAYINILIESGKVDKKLINASNYPKFRLNKFLNEIEVFSKDKRGINISILVVELMHFLIRKEYDKLMDKLDALNQYTYRYLRNDSTLRSNCFIKMLLKIPDAEYHPIRTARYVSKYEKKLKANPLEVLLKSVNVEIIPFENLWEIIIDILDVNLKSKKRG
jgi:hypothetical protein